MGSRDGSVTRFGVTTFAERRLGWLAMSDVTEASGALRLAMLAQRTIRQPLASLASRMAVRQGFEPENAIY
jgi:hypothetical protein